MSGRLSIVACVLVLACNRSPEQVANPNFEPSIDEPTHASTDASPTICVDEAHHEFHTLAGRYAPFVAVLRADGYRVEPQREPFDAASLANCDVLVIANALHERNTDDWSLPTLSAFTRDEIASVHAWVEAGRGLWLIADHMPFPGAAQELAGAFGFELANGFALREGHEGPDLFTRANGGLATHPLAEGVEQVASFTGEAFRAPADARPLLVLGPGYVSLEPQTAWEFDEHTPRREVEGWLQAATLELGEGRVAMFGEAAMFTSQVVEGGPPVGLDHPDAQGNTRLLRNLASWLSE
ncbi:DUF4350 domain-containing protein [Nannocystaceae bacterium ST9]